MKSEESQQTAFQPEVPGHIFQEFLLGLEKADLPPDLVERLRATIITNNDLSDKAIRTALFPEDESND